MSLQPHSQLPAAPSRNHQPHHDPALSIQDDERLLRLFWPDLDLDQTSLGHYHILIELISFIFDDIHRRFKVDTAESESALETIVKEQTWSRSAVETRVQQQFKSAKHGEAPRNAFLSILKLWTMLDIQLEESGYSLGIPVWLTNENINEATKRFFNQKTMREQVPEVTGTIDRSLTAAHLAQTHGIEIVPTKNLADHLTINFNEERKRRTLRVFQHKVWVLNHQTFPDTSPIPSDVLTELMATFNLLFPGSNPPTEALLKKLGMTESFYALGSCGGDRSLNWSDYRYWRKSIYDLNEILNEAPSGVKQLTRVNNKDKNSLPNLILFWVAGVMVATLTIASTVCGAWSVNLAIKALDISIQSMDISVRGLELAIAQACADPETAAKLSKYCPPP